PSPAIPPCRERRHFRGPSRLRNLACTAAFLWQWPGSELTTARIWRYLVLANKKRNSRYGFPPATLGQRAQTPGRHCPSRGARRVPPARPRRGILHFAGALAAQPLRRPAHAILLDHQPLPWLRIRVQILLRPLHSRIYG